MLKQRNEQNEVSVAGGSEQLLTLKFKCDVGEFIAECYRLIQFKLRTLHSLPVLKQ